MSDNKRERNEYFEDRSGTDDARFHVVPHDEEWAVKREGEDDPVYTTGEKNEAVSRAKNLAKDAGTIAYIHNSEGRITDQVEYGK